MFARDCDLVVAGGGPAGAVAALTAARCGLDVVLAEASPLDADAGSPLAVGESLPPAARPLLEALGLLHLLEDGTHLASWGNRSAWGTAEVRTTDFIRDARGQHGWHLDRQEFDAALRREAKAAGVKVLGEHRVRQAHSSDAGEDRWTVELQVPYGRTRTLRPAYVVDATGRAAAVARRLAPNPKAEHPAKPQRQIALPVLFTTDSETDQDARTLVESVPDGWWYSALLPERRRMVILFTDADLVRPTERRVADLERRLSQTVHLSRQLDEGGWQAERTLRPHAADAAQHRPMAGPGWLAVGDAAVAFDPLASQGLFHALYCGLKAGPAVAAALNGSDESVAELALRLDEVFRQHRRQCKLHYLAERRFADRPYWQRRHGMT